MHYQWVFEPQADIREINRFAKELNAPKTIANILINRGISTYEDAVKFFTPKLKNLHDPFLMKDMDKAVERITEAIENKERILIYGDYDTDGTTAVALMYWFLQEFDADLDFYVPDRYTEGYGVSFQGIDYAAETGASLIIALDCGIKAVDKVEYAKEKNIDFIICDHHTPGDKLPDAVAVLDPKRSDCPYPYKELTGCGIGFKLTEAFSIRHNIDKIVAYQNLDLVAVSTAADIVPITGENRILTATGLKVLKNTLKPGLKALIESSGLKDKDITVSDCVFKISPRINAAGRLEHAKNSINLLITKDLTEAENFVGKLNQLNQERQKLDRQITEEVLQIFEENPHLKEKKSTVLYNENWHKGVIGIVASKVIEKYYKPTIIFTKSNDKITGSARSIEGFDLYQAIDRCSDLLENFGGHKFAAGLTLSEENLEKFAECFENSVNQFITPEQQTPKLFISDILEFSDITNRLAEILKYFAPYGPGNMKPVFFSANVRDTGASRLVGDGKHISLELTDPTGYIVKAIAFGFGDYYEFIRNNPFDICYTIEQENFNGYSYTRLNIKDLRIRY